MIMRTNEQGSQRGRSSAKAQPGLNPRSPAAVRSRAGFVWRVEEAGATAILDRLCEGCQRCGGVDPFVRVQVQEEFPQADPQLISVGAIPHLALGPAAEASQPGCVLLQKEGPTERAACYSLNWAAWAYCRSRTTLTLRLRAMVSCSVTRSSVSLGEASLLKTSVMLAFMPSTFRLSQPGRTV